MEGASTIRTLPRLHIYCLCYRLSVIKCTRNFCDNDKRRSLSYLYLGKILCIAELLAQAEGTFSKNTVYYETSTP